MGKKTLKLNYEPPVVGIFGTFGVEIGFCTSGDSLNGELNERYGSENYTWE